MRARNFLQVLTPFYIALRKRGNNRATKASKIFNRYAPDFYKGNKNRGNNGSRATKMKNRAAKMKKEKPETSCGYGLYGGERGIRTLGTLPYTTFPMLHLRPLGQLSTSLTQ